MPKIIEIIKTKSKVIQELTTIDPFPSEKYFFEHKYFRFTEFRRTIDRFYENEVIGIEKNINGETLYKIKYSMFNGKLFRGKASSDAWQFIGVWCGVLMAVSHGLRFGFNINLFIPTKYVLFTLLFIVFSFSKREIFGFYDKNGEVEYWAYVNKNEKEKVEKIIEYVKSRIPEENKE